MWKILGKLLALAFPSTALLAGYPEVHYDVDLAGLPYATS